MDLNVYSKLIFLLYLFNRIDYIIITYALRLLIEKCIHLDIFLIYLFFLRVLHVLNLNILNKYITCP